MAEQIILPRAVLDANGDPISGAKLTAFLEGTSTAEPIYSDEALTTAHPSPLVADAGGNFPPIWHAGDHGVKIVITDASDVEIDWSPLDPCPMTSSATTASNISFTPTPGNPASNVQEAIENITGVVSEVEERAANFTLTASDVGKVFRCTADLTATLTAAATLGDGWYVWIKGDGGTATIDPDGSETVNGSTTKIIANGSSTLLVCDGAAFHTVSENTGWELVETFYDFATDGTQTEIETPDWEDGYQYMVVYNDLSPDTASLSRLSIAFYIEASSSYSTFSPFGASPVADINQKLNGRIVFTGARMTQHWHNFDHATYADADGTYTGSVTTDINAQQMGTTHTAATKIGKVKFKCTAGDFDGLTGNASLYRMRSAV